MQIKKTSTVLKLSAFCTLIVFSITSVSWPAPVLAPAVRLASAPPDFSTLRIPSELATLEEMFKGRAENPTVILIQDAHCVLDAQKNIAGLIDLFQKQNGLNVIALEGGAGKLDPTIFRAFPDRTVKEAVFNEYLKRGEISGAEWASILNEKSSEFWGIEDKTLYDKNKDAYLKANRGRVNLEHELTRIRRVLDEFKRELFTPELKELDERAGDFRRDRAGLEPLLAFLEKFESHDAYPTIAKFLSISEEDFKANKEKLLAELAAEDLFSEIEKYIDAVKQKLAPSEDVRSLIDLYGRLDVLTDLAALRMSRDAFEKYRLDRAAYEPAVFQAFAEQHGKFIDLSWNLDAHEEFYAIALKRDQVMHKNIRRLLAQKNERLGLFIAGGFHSAGITREFRDLGISYILLTPRINALADETPYEAVMKGEVSYRRFLNHQQDMLAPDLVVLPHSNAGSAFLNGAGFRLAKGIKTDRGETFKLWHDAIIRLLAEEGRILKSENYTRFVKALFDFVVGESGMLGVEEGNLDARVATILNEYTNPYFEERKKDFLLRLNHFMDSLRALTVPKESTAPLSFPLINPETVLKSLAGTDLVDYFNNWRAGFQQAREKFPEVPAAALGEGEEFAAGMIRSKIDPDLTSAEVGTIAGAILKKIEPNPEIIEQEVAAMAGFGAESERTAADVFNTLDPLPGKPMAEKESKLFDEWVRASELNSVVERISIDEGSGENRLNGAFHTRSGESAAFFIDSHSRWSIRGRVPVITNIQSSTKSTSLHPLGAELFRVILNWLKNRGFRELRLTYRTLESDPFFRRVLNEWQIPGRRAYVIRGSTVIIDLKYLNLEKRSLIDFTTSAREVSENSGAVRTNFIESEAPVKYSGDETNIVLENIYDQLKAGGYQTLKQVFTASLKPENVLGVGSTFAVYGIPGITGLALRVPKKPLDSIKFIGRLDILNDPLPDLNVGQAIAHIGEIQFVKRQKGVRLGVPFEKRSHPDASSDRIYETNLGLVAALSDRSYEAFAQLLSSLNRRGFVLDFGDPSNVLLDIETGTLNVIDVHPLISSMTYPDSLARMINVLLNDPYAKYYKAERQDVVWWRQFIIRKSVTAAANAGLSVFSSSDSEYEKGKLRSALESANLDFDSEFAQIVNQMGGREFPAGSLVSIKTFSAPSGFGSLSTLTKMWKNRSARYAVIVGFLTLGLFAASAWKASQLEAASIHTISLNQYEVILQKPNENPHAYSLVPGPMYTEKIVKGELTKVPTGWLIHAGEEINPFNKNSKGLAVQKAVFVIDKTGKAYIGRAGDTVQETLASLSKTWGLKRKLTIDDIEQAFQAGPIGIENGELNNKLLEWVKIWPGRKVLIGIKENGDLITREVFGVDPFGKDGPSGTHVINILQEMRRDGAWYVMFGDGGSTFSGDTGIFGKPPIFELGVVPKDSIAAAKPSGFGVQSTPDLRVRQKPGFPKPRSRFGLPRFRDKKLMAFELLYALNLSGDPYVTSDFELINEFKGPLDSTVFRIKIPRPSQDSRLVQGTEIFYRELAPTLVFDLLYDDLAHLVAVFPVTGKMISGSRLPRYFDFSPYYFEIPRRGDRSALRKWKSFAARYERSQALIRQFIQSRKLDIEKAYGQYAPYVYVEFDKKNYQAAFESFYPKDMDNQLTQRVALNADKEQLILPVFPSVYSPAGDDHQSSDTGYLRILYEGKKVKFSAGQRVLLIGPGSGIDAWLVWLKTRNRVHVVGINPLEIANVRTTARIAGFQVIAKQHDNLIAKDGMPAFRALFDRVVWNMPRLIRGSPSNVFEELERNGETGLSLRFMWDGDFGGVDLQRFASGLSKALVRDGEGLIWNGYEAVNGQDPIIEQFNRRGLEAETLEVDPKLGVAVYSIKKQKTGFGAARSSGGRPLGGAAPRGRRGAEAISAETFLEEGSPAGKFTALSEEAREKLRAEFKEIFAPMNSLSPYVLSSDKNMEKLITATGKVFSVFPGERHYSVGRTPGWFFEAAKLLGYDASKLGMVSFSGISRRAPPTENQINAFRRYLSHPSVGLSPKDIVSRTEKTVFVDYVETGKDMNDFLNFIREWAREEGLENELLSKVEVLMLKHEPSPYDDPALEQLVDFRPFRPVRLNLDYGLLHGLAYAGNFKAYMGIAFPNWKWDQVDPVSQQVTRRAALVRFRIMDYMAARGLIKQSGSAAGFGTTQVLELDITHDRSGSSDIRQKKTNDYDELVFSTEAVRVPKNVIPRLIFSKQFKSAVELQRFYEEGHLWASIQNTENIQDLQNITLALYEVAVNGSLAVSNDKTGAGVILKIFFYPEAVRNQGGVLRVTLEQGSSQDYDWQRLQVNQEGFEGGGPAYLIDRLRRARDQASWREGFGLYRVAYLMQETPTVLRYRRNRDSRHAMETILDVQLPAALAVSGFGAEYRAPVLPDDFGKEPFREFGIGGRMEYPITAGSTIEVRKIQTQVVPIDALNRFALSDSLTFRIIPLEQGPKDFRIKTEAPISAKAVAAPQAGYLLQMWINEKWVDLDDVNLEDGVPVIIKRGYIPKKPDVLLDIDLEVKKQFDPRISDSKYPGIEEKNELRAAIFWLEGGLMKTVYLPRRAFVSSISRGVERNIKRPGYDMNTGKFLSGYLQTGHLEIEIMGDAVKFSDLGSTNGTRIEVSQEWFQNERTRIEQAQTGVVESDESRMADLESLEASEGVDVIELKPNSTVTFTYNKPFSAAAVLHHQEIAKVEAEVRRGSVLYVKTPEESEWHPAWGNKYVSDRPIPVAGQESLTGVDASQVTGAYHITFDPTTQKITVFNFSASRLRIAFEPEPGDSMGPLGFGASSGFGVRKQSTVITGQDLFNSLKSKYEIRNLLMGGPIRQPEFFVAIRRDDQVLSEMQNKYGAKKVEDRSYLAAFVEDEDTLDFIDLAKGIVSGAVQTPLIYKPNRRASGQGIFFIEKGSGGSFTITMSYFEKQAFGRYNALDAVEEYFNNSGIFVSKDAVRSTMQAVLNTANYDVVKILTDVWRLISIHNADHYGEYDSGMMESIMSVSRYENKAYETRHSFNGNLFSGAYSAHKEAKVVGDQRWFARVGSSAFFSNFSGRIKVAHELEYRNMFDPLFKVFNIQGERRSEFGKYVDKLIQEEFQFLVSKLKSLGIEIDHKVNGNFDLMWLPPDESSNGFPVPALIEAAIYPTHSNVFELEIPVREISTGFGASAKSQTVESTDYRVGRFNRGFLSLRDRGFVQRGENIYLVGNGASEAALEIPRSRGERFEDFQGYDFEEFGYRHIYMRFSSLDEWNRYKNLFRFILDARNFTGRVFVEVELEKGSAWNPESPLWKQIQGDVEALKEADTRITAGLLPGPEGFNAFTLDVKKDETLVAAKFESAIKVLSVDQHLIRTGDSVLVISDNADNVNSTVSINGGYVAVLGTGLKELAENESILMLRADRLPKKILVRFTSQEWELYQRRIFQKLLSDDEYDGQVFVEIEGFKKEHMREVREFLYHLNGRAIFHSWDFDGGVPAEFSGFLIEISKKPVPQPLAQPKVKARLGSASGFGADHNGRDANGLYDSVSGILMSLASANNMIEHAGAPRPVQLNYWKLDESFVNARVELQNGANPESVRKFLMQGRQRVDGVLTVLRHDLANGASLGLKRYQWGLDEYELTDLERALADTITFTDSAVRQVGEILKPGGFGSKVSDSITGEQLFNSLKRKFEIRSLLRGGPIRQPDFFRAIERDRTVIESMRKRYHGAAFEDRSFGPLFAKPGDAVDFSDFVAALTSGQIKSPLVFKPNGQAVGEGIVFIEQAGTGFVLTISVLDGFYSQSHTEVVERYLDTAGIKYVRDQDKGIMQIFLDKNIPETLLNIWELMAKTTSGRSGIYDSGMVESLIPAVRHNGMAYETRHPFQGNLRTGESSPVIIDNEDKDTIGGWYGKLGSSVYFANQIGRSGSSSLSFNHMFDPLFKQFNIGKGRKAEFQRYIEKMIRDEFSFLVDGLKGMGIHADYKVAGQFDLMWLPPEKGSNGFPVPVLIEAAIVAPDQDLRTIYPAQKVLAGFGFENKPAANAPLDILVLGDYKDAGALVKDVLARGVDAVANELELRFENNNRSKVANLAKALADIVRNGESFDENLLREKLESALPGIQLRSNELRNLWVELFILKSRLEFLTRPTVRGKENIPAVNVNPFLDSMPDRVVRARAVKNVTGEILEAFQSSPQDSGSAVVVYTWETFPKKAADILALAEKISGGDRLVLFHRPDDDLSAATDLLKKNNGRTLTPAETNGLLEILKNKRMYYDRLNPAEVNKARGLEQGLSVLLKEILQVQNGSVGGMNTKFVLLLNEPELYGKLDGLSDLVQQVARSLAHLDGMRRKSGDRARTDAGLLEKEILDRIGRFGFVSGTDGKGGHFISFNLAVFLQRVQENYNALIQTSIAA